MLKQSMESHYVPGADHPTHDLQKDCSTNTANETCLAMLQISSNMSTTAQRTQGSLMRHFVGENALETME